MKLQLPLTLLAAAALAFGVHLLRSSQKVAIIDGPPSSETVPVEEQMRDSIIPPPVAEKTEATDPFEEPQFAPKIQLSRGKLGWEAAIESVTARVRSLPMSAQAELQEVEGLLIPGAGEATV